MSRRLFTIGHSTRTVEQFLALLRAHGVTGVADVRAVPRSRRHPHFSRDSVERWLPEAGVAYRHYGALGGLRRPRADSDNGGWRHAAFRGYADHMQTAAFNEGVEDLETFGSGRVVAVMCAEAKWWQCHRQLIADALVARGNEVRHILSAREAPSHELTAFARVDGGRVTYPAIV